MHRAWCDRRNERHQRPFVPYSHADVHRVDSGILEALKISSSKCLRIREPGRALVSLERRQHSSQRKGVKHVHYCGAVNQIDRAGRVFGRGFREELKPVTVDQRCGQCRSPNPEEAFRGLTARYHASASRQFVSILGVVDRKTSFLELWVSEDNARFARRAHQLGPRLVVLPVDADIIVYLLVLGDHLQPCQTLTQSVAEALAMP